MYFFNNCSSDLIMVIGSNELLLKIVGYLNNFGYLNN